MFIQIQRKREMLVIVEFVLLNSLFNDGISAETISISDRVINERGTVCGKF
jgi:hypothetical protein